MLNKSFMGSPNYFHVYIFGDVFSISCALAVCQFAFYIKHDVEYIIDSEKSISQALNPITTQ